MRNLPPLHKIYYNAGRSDKLYYFNANHLGSGSLITDGNGQTYQTLAYTPYGSQLVDIKHYSDIYNEPYRFGGKIKDEESGLNYFEARYYWDDGGFPISTDPHWYNYPHITSYNWCGQNPIMFIDPDGRDVWEVNDAGEIVNQIKDKTQDAFYMVAKDADGNYQRTKTTDTDGNEIDNGISFKYGTVTAVRTPTVNVQNSDGSITSNKLTTFEMKGDNNATQLFEFMANPGSTTNVEWSHAKVGTESSERNIVGTFHKRSSTAVGGYLRETGYTLREVNHNHPNGIGRPSGGDMRGAELYHKKNRNTILNIYTYPSKYFRYDQGGLIIP
jgi:RHS repeat-associated protein